MKNRLSGMGLWPIVLPLALLGLVVWGQAYQWAQARQASPMSGPRPTVVFNQKFVDGVYAAIDLTDPDALFKHVFAALDDEVTVYPTENYYYFTIYGAGKTVWGNLRLDVKDRDQGVIHMGFFEFSENGLFQDREGRQKEFSEKDGVLVRRLKPLTYAVRYGGKTVTFRLNDIGAERPVAARLAESETFVGPIFDESGLKFFLLYNHVEKHFLYLLNEEGSIPEEFVSQNDDVVIGKRSGFAFYRDQKYNRKVLVAVHGRSVDRNHWYDGPFDQLPDNYVEQTGISRYIQEAYPYTKGQIDQYGVYTTEEASRVLIFPYSVYYETDEVLTMVETCRGSSPTDDRFYACITPDPGQQPMAVESEEGEEGELEDDSAADPADEPAAQDPTQPDV